MSVSLGVGGGGGGPISSHLNTVHEMATPYPLHFGVFFPEFCYD